jgi:hypothetical protein
MLITGVHRPGAGIALIVQAYPGAAATVGGLPSGDIDRALGREALANKVRWDRTRGMGS